MSETDPIAAFRANVAEVDRLATFDNEILQMITMTIEDLHIQLKPHFADERLNGARALAVVRGIRANESVRSKYTAIYNQAVVLLVSHFASALGDLFRNAVSARLLSPTPGKLAEEEFKLTVSDLKERDWTLQGAIPDLLIAKYDFTFQDMGATCRAFSNYTYMVPERNEHMNNIIAAQACRHVIVHAGGHVSERAIRQVTSAHPRNLKPTLVLGEALTFTLEELEILKSSMLTFASQLSITAKLE